MPYVKKHKHRRHRHESDYYYRCHNWTCTKPIPGIVSIGGRTVRTQYCDTCLCQEVMGAQLCPQPRKFTPYPYCQTRKHIYAMSERRDNRLTNALKDLRCTHAGCHRDVKEYNPKLFRLCRTRKLIISLTVSTLTYPSSYFPLTLLNVRRLHSPPLPRRPRRRILLLHGAQVRPARLHRGAAPFRPQPILRAAHVPVPRVRQPRRRRRLLRGGGGGG